MRYRRFLVAAVGLALALVSPGAALAHTSNATYDFHVGDAFVQALGFPVGDQATAPNGDVVTIIGTGSFSTDGRWANGGGTFSHHVAATDATITGTWTANRVISFQSYGCGELEGSPLPPDFCGGRLQLGITATPDASPSTHLAGALTITCVIGPDVLPSSEEGVRVNIYDVINFNKTVPESGANTYNKH